MSRANVGDVYAKVIKDVCEQSRVDFEEGGVELTTLDLLQSEWQKKLSGLKVAQLPWDPTPVPQKDVPAPPKATQQPLPNNQNVIPAPAAAAQQPPVMPQIKQETQQFPSQPPIQQPYTMPNFPQGQQMSAKDRAASLLHQSYGDRAGPQIAQLQQSSHSRTPMPPQAPHQPGFVKQEDQKPNMTNLQDFRTDLPHPAASIKSGQTDGAGDDLDEWKSEYARRKALIMQERRDMRLMREQFHSTQQQLEGGGLMVPLEERYIADKGTRSKLGELEIQRLESEVSTTMPSASAMPSVARAQGDAAGDDDDDEDDENAINSDLDDPDELALNEENGENTDQVMLCTYDKVQRVKNKWKCTLKDGILRVEGTEYVFHKGQGEFEW